MKNFFALTRNYPRLFRFLLKWLSFAHKMLLYNGKCDPVIVSNKHTSVGFSTDFKTGSRGGRGSLYWTRSGKEMERIRQQTQTSLMKAIPDLEVSNRWTAPPLNTQHLARWGGLSTPCMSVQCPLMNVHINNSFRLVGYNTNWDLGEWQIRVSMIKSTS